MSSKWVYQFNEGDKSMKNLLGGKGANLAEMTTIGLPVPPGFTITTEVCNHYSANASYPDGVDAQVSAALAALEADTGKKFGASVDPLLISVRSLTAALNLTTRSLRSPSSSSVSYWMPLASLAASRISSKGSRSSSCSGLQPRTTSPYMETKRR